MKDSIKDIDWDRVIKVEPIKIKTGGGSGIGIAILIGYLLLLGVTILRNM